MELKIKKHKGMTLVECIAYISISSLLMIIEISLVLTMYSNFYITLNTNKSINAINNGINNLNKIIRETEISDITYEGNKIRIKKKVDYEVDNIKEIYLNNHNIIVEYLTMRNTDIISEGKNVLMINIDNFEVLQKENLLYMKIESGGEKYIQCI